MRVWYAPLLCAALVVGCESGDDPSTSSQAVTEERAGQQTARLREWFDVTKSNSTSVR
jgi:hypothetical protein